MGGGLQPIAQAMLPEEALSAPDQSGPDHTSPVHAGAAAAASPLFRSLRQWHPTDGSELLSATPISVRLAVLLAFTAFLLATIVASLVPYPRRAAAHGKVVAQSGSVALLAGASGTVTGLSATLNQVVSKGQPLLTISDERVGPDGELLQRSSARELQSRLSALNSEMAVIEVEARAEVRRRGEREHSLHQDSVRLYGELDIGRKRLELKRDEEVRTRGLVDKGFVTAASLEKVIDDRLTLEAAIAALERGIASTKRQLIELQSEQGQSQSQLEVRRSQIQRQLSELRQALTQQQSDANRVVTATIDGRIASVSVVPGQTVQNSTVLLVLHPWRVVPMVELCAGSRDLPSLRPGQSVRLRYEAFPVERFGVQDGTVVSIARSPIADDVSGSACFRVDVRPARPTITTKQGEVPIPLDTPVRGDIQLSDESLLTVLIHPLLRAGRSL